MIEMEIKECSRCRGTGSVTAKGQCAVLCSCPAGRALAAPPAPIRVFFWPIEVRARG